MSTTNDQGSTTAVTSAITGKSAEQNKAPRRGTLQSGFSLLARAEPQVWFTGGMLAVCLAMVVSLLALILASGLPTFWPQPIDWLVLGNGDLVIGEAQSSAIAPEETDARSYYYRTENFDLTNTHYRWFTPQELKSGGIVRVPSSTLIERFEWGHLYGIPLRIHEPIEMSEVDRAAVEVAFECDRTLQVLQTIANADSSSSEATKASLVAASQALQAAMVKNRSDGLRRELDQSKAEVKQVRVQGSDRWQLASSIDAESQIESVRFVITAPDDVLRRVNEVIPTVYSQRKSLERLKHELSRLDVRISKLRVGIRQAELDTKSVLPVQLDGCHAIIERRSELEALSSKIAECKKSLPSFVSDASTKDAVLAALSELETKQIPAELDAVKQQLIAWQMPLEKSPAELRDAVAAYEKGYAEVLVEKQPIEKQLVVLQAELDRGELIVCVPNGAKELAGCNREDAQSVAQGKLTESVSSSLKEQSFETTDRTNKLFSNDSLTLTEFIDTASANHLLAVASPDLLADSSTSGLSLLTEHPVSFKELVRVVPVNEMSIAGKASIYLGRWGEFLFEDPREANTLGGVFPAIWGTIVMTLIMTIAVVPFGVMAALYLREYTKGGALVSIIRISINNLAGVPSIVYGVFGFSFFCMTIGSFIDGGPRNADITVWPSGTWYLVLWLTVVVGTAAFLFSFVSSGPIHSQTQLKRILARLAFVLWILSLIAAVALIAKSPFFDGFYAAQLPNPTFGKGGLLWASLTLALLTLPVVIVATEEALAAVPNSLREGSLACGASKWQTIRRIVLPHARPGILTGAILAMARGAGEVAPLMLVGALPNAPELPMDSEFPFFHGSRNFMHLGYQIYSLGFQSQNSEAAKPMVFTCTLLLILIVAALNVVAIYLRTQLRRRFQGNQF